MPTKLMGLSPQEISQISTGRRANEASQMRQVQALISALGQRKTANLNKEKFGLEQQKFELEEEKFERLKNPPMIQMKTEGGQIYEVPKAAQAEGIRAQAYVDDLYRTGKLDKAKHDAWMKPVVMSIPDGAGGWIPYEVPSGMLQATADSMKKLQDVRERSVEATRMREGLKALGGQTVGDIKDIPLSTLIGTMPTALPSLVSRPKTGTTVAMKPEERRKLMKDQETSAFNMLEEKMDTSEASIASYNDRSKSLGYPSMMFRYSGKPTKFLGMSFGGDKELIEVKLPVSGGVQTTPEDVLISAKQKGISISQRLQQIHEGMLIIEEARKARIK